ncbi:RPM1-interacting protein 4-like [Cucurbita moschata]|uniref:RPM1-interacting protein 4-like n=1 Tax=Cucurbita moschata TaxID=3662 RepID=A0A6J1GSU2_CUCMO|nr:RPM1-interacting protein 4-like [Cucurbita moschata]
MAGAKSSFHVPKFGNWDTDDVPYTICFENARELRAAGITFDPNDPDTYPPEVFKPVAHDGGEHQRRPRQQPNRERGAIINSGSEKLSSERSGSDYALLKKSKENGVEGISRLAPAVAGHGGNPASVPKFGSWDARDPKSGDGYTAIFNKMKIEKQIAASNPQSVPPLMNKTKQPIAHTNTTSGFTSFASKICCCLRTK